MLVNHNQRQREANLTCPQCQRQHQLAQGNLLAGGKFRCPCGWSMRVVCHQREGAVKAKPAG